MLQHEELLVGQHVLVSQSKRTPAQPRFLRDLQHGNIERNVDGHDRLTVILLEAGRLADIVVDETEYDLGGQAGRLVRHAVLVGHQHVVTDQEPRADFADLLPAFHLDHGELGDCALHTVDDRQELPFVSIEMLALVLADDRFQHRPALVEAHRVNGEGQGAAPVAVDRNTQRLPPADIRPQCVDTCQRLVGQRLHDAAILIHDLDLEILVRLESDAGDVKLHERGARAQEGLRPYGRTGGAAAALVRRRREGCGNLFHDTLGMRN